MNKKTSPPLIECIDAGFKYDGKIVLEKVSFSLQQGEYLCVVGENGCGKSTLFKGILGLIKAFEGEIKYNGISKDEIGYMPQKVSVQRDFPASVLEIVRSGALSGKSFFSFYSKDDKCRTEDTLKLLGIENIKKKAFSELSGGQQQRVLLARTFCAAKKLIMLDEPINSLDPTSTAAFYKLLHHINKAHGTAVMMISHDINAALQYADSILQLGRSNIFFGSTDEYKNSKYYAALNQCGQNTEECE